ncbi:DUF1493 family protein [Leadbetterella sp. DM7]|uniref:DUF1493 family protein n=1 Tax=Leadbetterella sp. DM7 TaxID=3235085 RepID=UPI00349E6242
MDRNIFLKEVKEIANLTWGVRPKSLDDTIRQMRVASDDIEIFLEKYADKYAIDMQDYDYLDYFYDDNFFVINIFREIGFLLNIATRKPELTFEHLFKIAENKKWENPFTK